VQSENIECDFTRCSNYIYANTKKEFDEFDEEADAAGELGLDAWLEKDGTKLCFKNHGYIEIRNQAKFHPLKFIVKLAEKLSERGVAIFEKTEATEILDRDFGYAVRALGHSIQSRYVVCATYHPFKQPARLFFKKGMYKSYVLEAHTEWKIPEGTYEDTDNPYHYFRVDKNGQGGYRIIIGGEDHREDVPVDQDRNFNALNAYLESIIPKDSIAIRRSWTGPILEPVDGLAYIGKKEDKKNIFYAFAFSGNGMTYSAIAAGLLTDMITDKTNELERHYKTKRLPHMRAFITKGKDYTEELVRGALKNVASSSKKLSRKIPRPKEDT
jgi:glycine/D-amino acid oxidase-like deaminating enzyme